MSIAKITVPQDICAGPRRQSRPELAHGYRVSSGAGLVVSVEFHDAVAARIANEFLDAPTRLSFDLVLVMTGGVELPSWLLVVVAAGRVHTTTSRRAHRWARGTVRHRAGEGSADARAILD
jgi:hypothetical protein